MSESNVTPEILEQLLDRLSKASERISSDIEEQAKQMDRRIKAFVDQGEKVTDRLVTSIDKELRVQIASLRGEIEQLARRVTSVTSSRAAPKPSPMKAVEKRPVAKKPAAKKRGVKKAATKKAAAAKRSPAKKTASRRMAA
jgi:DNA topoisomerase I